MTEGIKTFIYPVKDLAKAKTLYSEILGVEPYMDEPYYVGFDVEGQDVGLDPHGHSWGMMGPVGYWHVDDIKGSVKALLDAGAEAQQEVKDVGGGKLIASVKDSRPEGTRHRSGVPLFSSTHPTSQKVHSPRFA